MLYPLPELHFSGYSIVKSGPRLYIVARFSLVPGGYSKIYRTQSKSPLARPGRLGVALECRSAEDIHSVQTLNSVVYLRPEGQ